MNRSGKSFSNKIYFLYLVLILSIIVNASPVGMYPQIDSAPQIPYEFITENHVVFDTIYNPSETMLMKLAAEKGATVKNGLEMLEGQAIAAWEIWNNKQ